MALGTAVLVAGGIAYYLVNQSVENTDVATGCDRGGPKAVQLILLDGSDPLDGVKAEVAKARVLATIKAAPAGARIDVYLADRADGSLGEPDFSRCNPGEPSPGDALISDAKRKREAYETGYLAAVEAVMDKVLNAAPQKASPIIESLRSAATKSFARLPASTPTSITIVSDMVQNSMLFRHRAADENFDAFKTSPNWPDAIVNLHGAAVHIIYVTRPNYRAIQSNAHISWWARYFSEMNGIFADSEAI